MREKGVEKTAGCSWVEVNNIVHEFLMGDFSYPKSDEIYSILVSLSICIFNRLKVGVAFNVDIKDWFISQ
ncbi:pentatricopeptide repeat-containing protein [Panicum miliaceum]|uniref:Pentatricopeptide repeat-containing protein n=1 Tax=Panicum miliaceum TaxID=4540 RepID=A0A3L6SX14_PANMI|nr:pentatricopeptide repeat-containing protein [Panicum miliaceum]